MDSLPVLVLGNYRQTPTVIRSLARAGHTVIVGAEGRHSFSAQSRWVAEVWRCPSLTGQPQAFSAALAAFLDSRPEVRWIYPVGDLQILFCADQAANLPSRLRYVMADTRLVNTCLDKSAMYALAADCGVPVAGSRVAGSQASLRAAIAALGYPVIVKPASSLFRIDDAKAIILRSADDLGRCLRRWPESFPDLIAQRYCDGSRHNCSFLAHDGSILAYFEHRVIRTDRPDGTGYIVDAVTTPPSAALRDLVQLLVRRVGYAGVGLAQFIVDEATGATQCFLEINARLDASCAIPFNCGYDFPRMNLDYCRYLAGELAAPPVQDATYATGRRAASTFDDLAGIAWARQRHLSLPAACGSIALVLATAIAADIHLTWCATDPLPTLWRFAHGLRSWLRG